MVNQYKHYTYTDMTWLMIRSLFKNHYDNKNLLNAYVYEQAKRYESNSVGG